MNLAANLVRSAAVHPGRAAIRRVWLLEALPKGPTGKVLKREIQPPAEESA